jgi:flavin reductase (DIM6/NTAB) family NADH-FMN oxidoreductase RutF
MNFIVEHMKGNQVYNLLIGLVAPRPIALVTSLSEAGQLNAAPFSAYNYLCTDPPVVALGVTNRPDARSVPKDTARNIRRTGEFVVNVVTEDLLEQMNICATDFPADVDELEMAELTTVPSEIVKVPRIAEAQVVSMFVEDRFIDPAGPYVRSEELHAIGRMNGLGSYVRTRDAFITMPRIPYAEWKKSHADGDEK